MTTLISSQNPCAFLRTCFIHEQCVQFLSEKLKHNNQHQGGSEGLSLPRPPVEKRRSYLFPSRECKVMMRSSSSGEMLPRLRSGRR